MLGNITRGIGRMGGWSGIGRSIWNSNIGRGAIYGGIAGGMVGAFSDRSTIVGGAARAAVFGGMMGAAPSMGTKLSMVGGALLTGSPIVGGALGAGAFGAVKYGYKLGDRGLSYYRQAIARGITSKRAMGMAGKRMWKAASIDARRSARYIGNTARKGYNTFRSTFV